MPTPTERKPLATLSLLPFLVASSSSSSSSSSAAASPNKRINSLKARGAAMSGLLPSPFSATSTAATTPPRAPLAPLADAPIPVASLASPSRAMMLDDDAQQRADDDEPTSSPRRLIDAFLRVGSSSPDKRKSTRMLPPLSPRRAPAPAKDDELVPTWTFFEDDPSTSAGAAAPIPTTPTTFSDPASPSNDDEAPRPEKENARPPRRPRTRSLSTAPSAPLALPTGSATTSAAPHSPPRTPPAGTTPASAFFSPSPSLATAFSTGPDFLQSLSGSGSASTVASGATAPFAFAESGPTSFAAAALSPPVGAYGAEGLGGGAFDGLLPAFAAAGAAGGHHAKKRESLDGEGEAAQQSAKRARTEADDQA